MKSKLTVFIFLLLLPLALATTVTTDKTTYSLGEQVQISGTCAQPNIPVAFQLGIGLNTIWVEETTADNQNQFSITYQTTNQGDHTLYAACDGDTTQSTEFCVGDEIICPPPTSPEEEAPTPAPTGNGGGGRRCFPEWTCTAWSYCNASLKQTRTCTDTNNCQPKKTEIQDCPKCDESWVCTSWSDCIAQKQNRNCYDEHKCNTFQLKPHTQKACALPPTGPPPAKIIPTLPPTIPPEVEVPKPSLWDKYKAWLLGTPAALILLLLIILVTLHYLKPKKVEVSNIEELKNWVQQELQMGTPKEKIREIIHQQTGWTDQELDKAFEELQLEQQQPAQPPEG